VESNPGTGTVVVPEGRGAGTGSAEDKVSEECGRILPQVERVVWSTGQLLFSELWSTGHLSADIVVGGQDGDAGVSASEFQYTCSCSLPTRFLKTRMCRKQRFLLTVSPCFIAPMIPIPPELVILVTAAACHGAVAGVLASPSLQLGGDTCMAVEFKSAGLCQVQLDPPANFLSTPLGAVLRFTINAMFGQRSTTPAQQSTTTAPPSLPPVLPPTIIALQAQKDSGCSTLSTSAAGALGNGPIHPSTNPASFRSLLDSHRSVVAMFTSATYQRAG
jgi:hypothetical protein